MTDDVSGIGLGLTLDTSQFDAAIARSEAKLKALGRNAGGSFGVSLAGQIPGLKQAVAITPVISASRANLTALRGEIRQAFAGQPAPIGVTLGRSRFAEMRREISAGIGAVPIQVTYGGSKGGTMDVVTAIVAKASGISKVSALQQIRSSMAATGTDPQNIEKRAVGGPVKARASGGPVAAHETYRVNEKGEEFFTPGSSGHVTAAHEVASLRREYEGLGRAMGGVRPLSYGPGFEHAARGRIPNFYRPIAAAASRLSEHNVVAGKAWYPEAASYSAAMAEKYNVPVATARGVLAVLSAGTEWESNKTKFEKILKAHASGAEFPYNTKLDAHAKAKGIIEGGDPFDLVRGPKISQFHRGISGDLSTLTLDRWATRTSVAGLKGISPILASGVPPRTGPARKKLEQAWHKVAREAGMEPAELQAALWLQEKEESRQAPGQRPLGLRTGGKVRYKRWTSRPKYSSLTSAGAERRRAYGASMRQLRDYDALENERYADLAHERDFWAGADEPEHDTRFMARGGWAEAYRQTIANRGGTFDPAGHQPAHGYAVELGQGPLIPLDNRRAFARAYKQMLGKAPYVGTWVPEGDDRIWMGMTDVARRKRDAEKLALKHGQIAYFDLKNFEEGHPKWRRGYPAPGQTKLPGFARGGPVGGESVRRYGWDAPELSMSPLASSLLDRMRVRQKGEVAAVFNPRGDEINMRGFLGLDVGSKGSAGPNFAKIAHWTEPPRRSAEEKYIATLRSGMTLPGMRGMVVAHNHPAAGRRPGDRDLWRPSPHDIEHMLVNGLAESWIATPRSTFVMRNKAAGIQQFGAEAYDIAQSMFDVVGGPRVGGARSRINHPLNDAIWSKAMEEVSDRFNFDWELYRHGQRPGKAQSLSMFRARGGEVDRLEARGIKHFGVTDNITEAGYLTPSGKYLDFSGRHEAVGYERRGERFVPEGNQWGRRGDYLAGSRNVDHREAYRLFPRRARKYDFEAAEWMMKAGFPRINEVDRIGYLGLDVGRELTPQQVARLRADGRQYRTIGIDLFGKGETIDDERHGGRRIGEMLRQANERLRRAQGGPAKKGGLPRGYKLEFYTPADDIWETNQFAWARSRTPMFGKKVDKPGDMTSVRNWGGKQVPMVAAVVRDRFGEVAAHAPFTQLVEKRTGLPYLHPELTEVEPGHEGKGLATAMYVKAERFTGAQVRPALSDQTMSGMALWSQKNRPFGKRFEAEAEVVRKTLAEDLYLNGASGTYRGELPEHWQPSAQRKAVNEVLKNGGRLHLDSSRGWVGAPLGRNGRPMFETDDPIHRAAGGPIESYAARLKHLAGLKAGHGSMEERLALLRASGSVGTAQHDIDFAVSRVEREIKKPVLDSPIWDQRIDEGLARLPKVMTEPGMSRRFAEGELLKGTSVWPKPRTGQKFWEAMGPLGYDFSDASGSYNKDAHVPWRKTFESTKPGTRMLPGDWSRNAEGGRVRRMRDRYAVFPDYSSRGTSFSELVDLPEQMAEAAGQRWRWPGGGMLMNADRSQIMDSGYRKLFEGITGGLAERGPHDTMGDPAETWHTSRMMSPAELRKHLDDIGTYWPAGSGRGKWSRNAMGGMVRPLSYGPGFAHAASGLRASAEQELGNLFPQAHVRLPYLKGDEIADMVDSLRPLALSFPFTAQNLRGLKVGTLPFDPDDVAYGGRFRNFAVTSGGGWAHLLENTIDPERSRYEGNASEITFRRTVGQYLAAGGTGVVGSRYAGSDLAVPTIGGVAAHEFGHAISNAHFKQPAFMKLVPPVSRYAERSEDENFAEAVAAHRFGRATEIGPQLDFWSDRERRLVRRASGGDAWGPGRKTYEDELSAFVNTSSQRAGHGPYIVNENGRELFVPRRLEHKIPPAVMAQIPQRKDGGIVEINQQPWSLFMPPEDGWIIPAHLKNKVPRADAGRDVGDYRDPSSRGHYIDPQTKRRISYSEAETLALYERERDAFSNQPGGYFAPPRRPGSSTPYGRPVAGSGSLRQTSALSDPAVRSQIQTEQLQANLRALTPVHFGGLGGLNELRQIRAESLPLGGRTPRTLIGGITGHLALGEKQRLAEEQYREATRGLVELQRSVPKGANVFDEYNKQIRASQVNLRDAARAHREATGAQRAQTGATLDEAKATFQSSVALKRHALDLTREQAEAAGALKAGVPQAAKSFLALQGAFTGYQLGLQAVSTAMELGAKVAAPLIDATTGWSGVALRVGQQLSDQTRELGGNTKGAIAQAAGVAGVSGAGLAYLQKNLAPTITAQAAASAAAEALDLRRAAFFSATRGSPPGLLGGPTGGIAGTGFGWQLFGGKESFSQTIARSVGEFGEQAKPRYGIEGTNILGAKWQIPIEQNDPIGGWIRDTFAPLLGGQQADGTYVRPPFGVNLDPTGQRATAGRDAIQSTLTDFNDAVARGALVAEGNASSLELLTKEQIKAAGGLNDVNWDDLVAKYKSAADGAGDLDNASKLAASGVVLFDKKTGRVVQSSKEYTAAFEQASRGTLVPSRDAYRATTERQVAAARIGNAISRELTTKYEIPFERGLALAANPFVAGQAKAGYTGGGRNGEFFGGRDGARFASQINAEISSAQRTFDAVQADATQWLADTQAFISSQVSPEAGAQFGELVGIISDTGQKIAQAQLGATRAQRDVNLANLGNQFRLASRSLSDALGLVGKRSGSSNLGSVERSQTLLGFDLSQRQINLQKAVAGFQVAGETSEERGARQAAAIAEANIAQKQLDLSKEAFSITAQRAVTDANASLDLIQKAQRAEAVSYAASVTIAGEQAKQQVAISKAEALFQNAMGNINAANQTAIAYIGQYGVSAAKAAGVTDDLTQNMLSLDNEFRSILGLAAVRATTTGVKATNTAETHTQATGILFDTAGPTNLTVGEAGKETVAVLRNPRASSLSSGYAGGGGTTITFGNIIIQNPVVRKDDDITAIAQRVEDRLSTRLAMVRR